MPRHITGLIFKSTGGSAFQQFFLAKDGGEHLLRADTKEICGGMQKAHNALNARVTVLEMETRAKGDECSYITLMAFRPAV